MKYSATFNPSTCIELANIISRLNPVELVTPSNASEEKGALD